MAGRAAPRRGWSRWKGRQGRAAAWAWRVLGIDPRELRSVGPEHVGQHIRQIVQQMKAVGHLAGGGRPQAGGFRIRLRPIPDDHLDPRMGLQPLGHGRGFPVGEESGPCPLQVQEDGTIGVTLPPREVVHAADLWRGDCRAGGPADHPSQGVPAGARPEDWLSRHRLPHRGPGRWQGGGPSAAACAGPKVWQCPAVAR